jgi:competence protein ComEC
MDNKISKSIIFFSVFIFSVASVFLKSISLFCVLLTISVLLAWHYKYLSKRFSIILMLTFTFGAIYTTYQTPHGDSLQKYVLQNVQITGTVSSIPKYENQKIKFYLDINKINAENNPKFGTTAVSIYSSHNPKIQIGDVISLDGKFQAPHKASNLGQFDYADYLQNQGIFTVFYSKNYKIAGQGNNFYFKTQRYFTNLAEKILQKHSKYLTKNQTDLLGGIVFGHRSINLNDDVKQDFINSGTFHILAASGMQIALVLLFWCFLMKLINLPYNLSLISGGIIIIFYACFTGFPASILRALLMAEFIILGKLIDRQADSVALLLFVCSIMLLYNPLSILDVGFQLSFITTFGLIFAIPKFSESFKNIPEWISSTILITLIAQIFASPLLMFYFNNLPLYSIFANILILPLVSIITFAGFLSGIFSLIPKMGFITMLFSKILGPSLAGTNWGAEFFSGLPNSLIFIKQISVFSVIISYIFIIFLVLLIQNGFKNRFFIAITTASLTLFLFLNINLVPQKNLDITFFNVGNSDAILVKLPNGKKFLVDTGRSNPYGASSGKTVIDEYLKSTGDNKLEAIILTHPDSDHIGGCLDVLKFTKPKKIYQTSIPNDTKTSQELQNYISQNKINVQSIPQNACIDLELDKKVKIKLYAPKGTDQNSNSLITYIEQGDFSALLMGDNERNVSDISKISPKKPISVMKLGHHGSKDSIDEKMINNLRPKNIVISVGKNNYQHPNPEVLNLLDKHQIRTYKTCEENMMIFGNTKNGLKVKKYYPDRKTIE